MRKTIFIAALVSLLVLSFVASAPAGDVLDRILKNGELVVGTTGTQPPLNATTKDGKIIGLDADIATLIAGSMGVSVRFETMPFAELLPALHADKVDMILSSMTMTPKRGPLGAEFRIGKPCVRQPSLPYWMRVTVYPRAES